VPPSTCGCALPHRPDWRSRVGTLIETVTDLPAGTLGFCASGKISSDEYRQMMEPIYAALERGEKLNIYFELAQDFHGLDSGALWQDVQAAGSVGLKHRSSWERMAVVTDKDWVRHGGERVRLARARRTASVRAVRARRSPRLARRDVVCLDTAGAAPRTGVAPPRPAGSARSSRGRVDYPPRARLRG
jgi:SpoIIAA-like